MGYRITDEEEEPIQTSDGRVQPVRDAGDHSGRGRRESAVVHGVLGESSAEELLQRVPGHTGPGGHRLPAVAADRLVGQSRRDVVSPAGVVSGGGLPHTPLPLSVRLERRGIHRGALRHCVAPPSEGPALHTAQDETERRRPGRAWASPLLVYHVDLRSANRERRSINVRALPSVL